MKTFSNRNRHAAQFASRLSALLAAVVIASPLATPLAAQSSSGIVLKGGLSYGDVSNSGVFPGGATTRNGAALGVGIVTNQAMGFGLEALYAQRGIVGSPGNSRELDYIDVPLYLRLSAVRAPIQPFAYVGPQISFELRCDSNGGDCPSGREKVSYAGTIGAGLRFPSAAGLSIEGRYVYGLNDLKLGTISDSESYRTRSFMILFGLGL